ncbi:fimbrial biogenesis outer membrane usher protein [Serratia symbiotica]|uniref:fimbria/pilus outer membrane usher protein n=1 Tax=Serratia symbiotica TaxID=138074 RepID=UPI00132CA86E|nr:fimbria/pilus outer membrane usher protein [Serratia symbiotica]MBF1995095.1 fimbrial biogenesis outer membrane usher protein [Serratia symbiotica]QTP15328.1 fimbrial biogenesis outer membrane usher protein [Serratia symbiotica]
MARKKITTSTPGYLARLINGIIYFSAVPFSFSHLAMAEEQFNTSFIHGDDNVAQVTALDSGDDILPGKYPFDIYLNGQRIDHRDIEFKKVAKDTPVVPCLMAQDYQDYGVKLPDDLTMTQCYALSQQISGAKLSYDAAIQRIDLDVPQVFLVPRPQGAIPPKVYDRGINAGFVNYNFSGNHNRYSNTQNGKTADYYFLGLNSGLNLGDWRLRNNSAMNQQSGVRAHWNNISSWAETDIVPLRSRLVIGQSSTHKEVFDSIQFRGVQLSSSNDMLPESQRGYAPVVRGVASSNARVEIRQNGYTIYSTNVPPGPFALTDIFPSTLSGNLDVMVIEANGAISSFVVPFSSVPNMLREGLWNYQLTVGKYHDGSSRYQPKFMQGTLSHGMTFDVTPYGGVLVAENYRSAVVGLGKNLGNWGALSFDMSYSDTHLVNGDDKQGESFRFLYSKSLNDWGTEFQIAGYRYSTSGYYDFTDAVAERDRYEDGYYHNSYYDETDRNLGVPDWAESRRRTYYTHRFRNKRQRVELSVNQRIAGSSTLYANLSNQSYWGGSGEDRSVQVGFNSSYKNISYGVFYQDNRSNYGYEDHSVNLIVSIPFSFFSKDSSDMSASFNAGHSKQSGNTYSAGLNGTALDDNRLNYSVQSGHDRHSGQITSANIGYQSSIGTVNAGYSYSNGYQQSSLRVAGGIVAHAGGVTLTQPLQNSFVLVEAKDAKGVRLENQPGVAIDRFGYAVMTSASPYRHNRVALRTEDIGNGLDIPMAARDVVPTYGAIARVKFETHTGQSLLVHSKMADGSVPPIGANVFNADGKNNGIVGTNGDIYISGVLAGDRLLVKWGSDIGESCSLLVPDLQPATKQLMGYQELSLSCGKPHKE